MDGTIDPSSAGGFADASLLAMDRNNKYSENGDMTARSPLLNSKTTMRSNFLNQSRKRRSASVVSREDDDEQTKFSVLKHLKSSESDILLKLPTMKELQQ